MSRKRDQAELLYQLGQLIGPLRLMAENPGSYDREERTRILARFFPGVPTFLRAFREFCRNEPGHDYQLELGRAESAFSWFHTAAMTDPDQTSLVQNIQSLFERTFEAVYAVPVPVESAIHEARTPFSTYCLVKDLCATTQGRIVWMDRYFDHTLFHRHLASVPPTAAVTLVTWPESKCSGNKDRQRYAAFMDVSRLYALERGAAGYRLVTTEDFHDRWLRCDDKLFALGGSIKDLGKETTFTISKLDATPENIDLFEEPLRGGTVVFGPSQPVHP